MDQYLSTKILIPPDEPNRVVRTRLLERLDLSFSRKLFLLSAPAGFGKTTLVRDWVRSGKIPAAWLSLDEGDNDYVRFFKYLIFALQTIFPGIGEEVLHTLQSPPLPPTDFLLTALINQITREPKAFILVLDDYHVIEESSIDELMIFLLENMPPHMHLIITTREDPQLPLARLRARKQLAELRVADLRFHEDETAQFLNEINHLNISESDISALDSRTEGWVAGLQLAVISMQGHEDKSAFIRSFTGTHHFVMDFLVEEVLQQQPEKTQAFLYQTAILDRMNAALCDAVIADPDVSSQEVLEYLHHANLFTIPLDEERRWFRYHHLFVDLLRQRLISGDGNKTRLGIPEVAELHLRASRWFEENGCLLEAFNHAVAANDVDLAECLLSGEGMPLQYRGAMLPVINWLRSLPEAVLQARPSLWVSYILTLTMMGKPVDNIRTILRDAEDGLKTLPETVNTRDTKGQIAAIRVLFAVALKQADEIIDQANLALAYLRSDNLPVRTMITWALGFAHQIQGQLGQAQEVYRQAYRISQNSGNVMMAIATSIGLGQVCERENQPEQSRAHYQQVLKLSGEPPLPYACEALLGLARIAYEQNDLETARHYAQQSMPLAKQLPNVDTPLSVELILARIYMAQANLTMAAEANNRAERFAYDHHFENRLPEIADLKTRLFLNQGDLHQAGELVQAFDLPLSLARVKLEQGDSTGALVLIQSYREEMEHKQWARELLETLILETVCSYRLGDPTQTAFLLNRVFVLAQDGKYIRLFLDEGQIMADIISRIPVQPNFLPYRALLLAAFDAEAPRKSIPNLSATQLIEPLSEREIEILQLIAQGCSNREIGERLYLALNTVKGHNRNLFGKLQAGNRTEAVARARELGIL